MFWSHIDMSTLDPHFLAKPGFVEQNGAHFWLICLSTSWLAEIGLNFFWTHKIRIPDFSRIRNKSGIRILWVQNKLRPISASQDVLWQMSQKWAPFCSTKLCLTTNANRNSTFLNGTKKFFSNMINGVMFWSICSSGDFFWPLLKIFLWCRSSTVCNGSPCKSMI